MRKRWCVAAFAVLAAVVVATIVVVLNHTSGSKPMPSRLASGPSLWVGVPIEERRYYLDDLLGQHWEPNYVIPDLTKTKLHGLTKAQVILLLGPPVDMHAASDFLSYYLGDLRDDKSLIDSIIEAISPGAASSLDCLSISFDPRTGLVSDVRITS
jgi:hypothetical protein